MIAGPRARDFSTNRLAAVGKHRIMKPPQSSHLLHGVRANRETIPGVARPAIASSRVSSPVEFISKPGALDRSAARPPLEDVEATGGVVSTPWSDSASVRGAAGGNLHRNGVPSSRSRPGDACPSAITWGWTGRSTPGLKHASTPPIRPQGGDGLRLAMTTGIVGMTLFDSDVDPGGVCRPRRPRPASILPTAESRRRTSLMCPASAAGPSSRK